MNKKVIIIAIIIIIIIIAAVIIFRPKENNTETSSQQGNTITEEEYNDNLIENIEEKFSSAGIEIRQNGIARFDRLEGNRYVIIEDGKETEKTFEMYPINAKEKAQILGTNSENGKVTIDETTQGILNGNVLIVNISDEELTNQIMEALNI